MPLTTNPALRIADDITDLVGSTPMLRLGRISPAPPASSPNWNSSTPAAASRTAPPSASSSTPKSAASSSVGQLS